MSPRVFPQIPNPIAALIDERLTGARCAGRHPLFDAELEFETPEARTSRLSWAAGQCRQCPVASACQTAATEQEHPLGIWNARVYGQPGRPQKGTAA
ncbi:WhiB family transcriptional regulator [Rhodococcus rhodochrous]|uniref:WhiB family transcriptional regulator n=1 Tax=Rhodococcus rhodochrous TaxID=1829 RepID=UPI0023F6F3B3